jgi:uncharacterized protein (DUF2147 family)
MTMREAQEAGVMKRAVSTVIAMGMAAATVWAAESVAGTWTMKVQGGPHGDATMGLVLNQEGTKVTGTFASGHSPDIPVSGEMIDGTLKVHTAAEGDEQVIFTAKLKGDGSLAGTISSPIGDMTWTAERVKANK